MHGELSLFQIELRQASRSYCPKFLHLIFDYVQNFKFFFHTDANTGKNTKKNSFIKYKKSINKPRTSKNSATSDIPPFALEIKIHSH